MNSRPSSFEPLRPGRRRPSDQADADSLDVRDLLQSLWNKRWLISGAALITGLVVYLALLQVTPIYSAYAKLIIEGRKTQIVTNTEVVGKIDPSKQALNGEVSILQANLLLEKVIQDLPASVQDRIDPENQPQSMLGSLKSGLKSVLGRGDKGLSAADLELMSAEERKMERMVYALRKTLSVYGERDSYVIVVRADYDDPAIARILANTVADTYIKVQQQTRRDAVIQASAFLELRLETLRADVETAEISVTRFQAENLLENGGTLENASQQLSNLNNQLITARSERVEAQARLSQLQTIVEQRGARTGANIVETITMQALRERELELQRQDAVWARTYDKDQPRRIEIRNELQEIGDAMESEVQDALVVLKNDFEVAVLRENSLRDSIAELEEKVISISKNSLGLNQLNREAQAARLNYESLLTRLTETRTQQELQQADAKLIQRATLPEVPSAPRPKLMAAFGAIVAGTLAVGFVLFNELTPTTFRTARELEVETQLPVLSALPQLATTKTVDLLRELRRHPFDLYAERVRQLRTAITFGSGGAKCLMLVSSVPNEGKTTTTLALAQLAALNGNSVIVVDCDLRQPGIAKALELKLDKDFGDFIEDHCTLDEAVVTLPELKFDVLALREPRLAATDQLSLNWLKPLLAELGRVYDLVLVDAPPILSVSDSVILSGSVDAAIYVVGCDSTSRNAVRTGLARLDEARVPLSGLVLSKAKPDSVPYDERYAYSA